MLAIWNPKGNGPWMTRRPRLTFTAAVLAFVVCANVLALCLQRFAVFLKVGIP